jgi:hypothetical protein
MGVVIERQAKASQSVCKFIYRILIFCLTKLIHLLYSIAHPFVG